MDDALSIPYSLRTVIGRSAAIRWAKELVQRPDWVVLDTETTGLSNQDEVIQVGILSGSGEILVDTLVRPTCPISPGAARVHGIREQQLIAASTFDQVYPQIRPLIKGKIVVVYNVDFDQRLIRQSLARYRMIPHFEESFWTCAMVAYSEYNAGPFTRPGRARWLPLPGASHGAVGDCIATRRVIQRMAEA